MLLGRQGYFFFLCLLRFFFVCMSTAGTNTYIVTSLRLRIIIINMHNKNHVSVLDMTTVPSPNEAAQVQNTLLL